MALPGCGRGEQVRAPIGQAAMERGPGQLKPLSEALALARRIAPGKVIDVELESDVDLDDDEQQVANQPRWIYEIEILTEDHRVIEIEIDAANGQLLEIDGAPWPPDIPRPQP